MSDAWQGWRRAAGRRGLALLVSSALAMGAWAQQGKVETTAAATNSSMDAQLLYQVLLGELLAREGDPGSGFSVLLDAGRRSKDDGVLRRAVEIALYARAGDSALQAARAWRGASPTSNEALETLVGLLIALDRPAELAEPLRALIRMRPVVEQPGVILGLPRYFASAKDKAGVLAAIDEALVPLARDDATRSAVALTLARMALMAGQHERAWQEAERAAADPTAHPLALGWLALELMPTRPQAETWLQQALRKQPDADLLTAYARALEDEQRLGEALEQVRAATAQDDAPATAWLLRGALHLQLGEGRAAVEALDRYWALAASAAPANDAVAMQQAQRIARVLQAQASLQVNDAARAQQWLTPIAPQDTDLTVLALRADVLARQGQLQAARELLRHAPAVAPPPQDSPSARARTLAEADLLREHDQYALAAGLLRPLLQAEPGDVDAAMALAVTLEEQGEREESERVLRAALAAKPDDAQLQNGLGYALADRGVQVDEARRLIERALAQRPRDAHIIDSLGWVAYRQGRLDEAERLLRQAHRQMPHVEVAAHLGEVLWVQGQQDEARSVWRAALARTPDNPVLKATLERLKVAL